MSTSFVSRRRVVERGGDDEAIGLEADRGPVRDPGRAEDVLRQAEPAATTDDDGVGASDHTLVAYAPVADMNDAVGVLDRRRVVADDERRCPVLAHELRDELEHAARRLSVELAGRLVGHEEPRTVRERGTERDPLLLAAGELARPRVAPIDEADALQQLVG